MQARPQAPYATGPMNTPVIFLLLQVIFSLFFFCSSILIKQWQMVINHNIFLIYRRLHS